MNLFQKWLCIWLWLNITRKWHLQRTFWEKVYFQKIKLSVLLRKGVIFKKESQWKGGHFENRELWWVQLIDMSGGVGILYPLPWDILHLMIKGSSRILWELVSLLRQFMNKMYTHTFYNKIMLKHAFQTLHKRWIY